MRRALLVCGILFSLCAVQANTQVAATPEIGANPFKSYSGGDIDHIQLQNGGLYIRIPILSYPQLGKLALSFSLLDNGNTWAPLATCDNQGDCWYSYGAPQIPNCYYGSAPASGFNPSDPYGVLGGDGTNLALILDQQLNYCANLNYIPWYTSDEIGNQVPWFYEVVPTYDIYDSSGSVHSMGYSSSGNYSLLYASDGSGLEINLPNNGSLSQVGFQPYAVTITEPNGVSHSLNGPSPGSPTSTWTSSDLNGNSITVTNSTTGSSIIDSVGRSIITGPMVPVSTNLCPNLSQLYGGNYPPATSAGQWNVPGPYGKTETYTFCDTTFPIATNFFGLNGGSINSGCNAGDADEPCAYQYWSEVSGEGGGLQSVVLPDGTVWGFAYDTTAVAGQGTYGDLTEVHLPSGGVLQYTYQNLQVCGYPFGESGFPLNRAVVQRVAKSISGPDIVTNYTYNPTQTIETDSSGNQTVHNFTLDNPGTMFCGASETSTQWFQGAASNSSTPLQEIDTTYHSVPDPQNLACPGSATVGGISAANCASPLGTYPTVTNRLPNNRTTQQNGQTIRSESYNYDQLFTDVQPWILDIVDYGQGAQSGCTWGIESSGFDFECSWASPDTSPFNLASISEPIYYGVPTVVSDGIKTTVTTRYAADHPAYQAVNLIDLPEAVTVCSSNGSECSSQAAAKTTYTYDGGGNTSLPKGNATSISRMISPSQSATTTQTFSPYGMITSTTDPIGNSGGANHTTSYKYDPTNNLYVISRTQPSTNGVAHVNYYQRDFNTGLLIAVTDENASSISDAAHSTNYTYDDAGRPTKVNYPDGGEVDVCVTDVGGSTCSKGSAPYQMFVTSQSSPSPDKVQRTTFDGLGRVIQTAMMSDPSGSDYVDSTYDSLGNLSSVSNPYRTTSFYLTTYGYDAIGRKTSQNQPGGTGSLGWSYSGNSVDSWDENRLHTRRQADLAGRITDVWEDSSGLNLHTQYLYDVLNNLTHVYQAGTGSDNPRTRTFTYDSLSRLLTANNPETGTVCYGTWSGASCIGGYDPNGNVITKTDARGVVTNYAYDGLNRLYAKTYTNAPAGTLSSCYQFDTAANGVGRLAVEWTQSGTCASTPPENFQSLRTYGAYDAMGRALTEQQCVAGFCTSAAVPSQPGPNCPTLSSATGLQYCYDLAGNLLAYSNGLTTAAAGPQYPQHALLFAQTFDSAGRLNSVTNSWPADPTHPQTLFSSPVYTPFNALSNWLLGTRLFTTRNYDSRLRVTDQSSVH